MGKRDRVKVVDVLHEVAKQDMVKAAPETTEAPTTEAPTTEAPTTEAPTTEPTATTDAPKGAKQKAIERVIGLFPEAKRAGWKVWCQELFYDNANTADRVRIVEEDIQDATAREAILAIVRGMEPAAPAKGTARKPAKLTAEGAKPAEAPKVFLVALVDACLCRVRVMSEHKTKDGMVTGFRVRQVDAKGSDLTQTAPDGTTVPAEGTVSVSDVMAEGAVSSFIARWERDRRAFDTRTFDMGDRVRVFDRGDGSGTHHDGTIHQSTREGFPLRVVWDVVSRDGDVSRDYTSAELSHIGFTLPTDPTGLYARLWKGAVELSRALGDYTTDAVVMTALRIMAEGARLAVHPAVIVPSADVNANP